MECQCLRRALSQKKNAKSYSSCSEVNLHIMSRGQKDPVTHTTADADISETVNNIYHLHIVDSPQVHHYKHRDSSLFTPINISKSVFQTTKSLCPGSKWTHTFSHKNISPFRPLTYGLCSQKRPTQSPCREIKWTHTFYIDRAFSFSLKTMGPKRPTT